MKIYAKTFHDAVKAFQAHTGLNGPLRHGPAQKHAAGLFQVVIGRNEHNGFNVMRTVMVQTVPSSVHPMGTVLD